MDILLYEKNGRRVMAHEIDYDSRSKSFVITTNRGNRKSYKLSQIEKIYVGNAALAMVSQVREPYSRKKPERAQLKMPAGSFQIRNSRLIFNASGKDFSAFEVEVIIIQNNGIVVHFKESVAERYEERLSGSTKGTQ